MKNPMRIFLLLSILTACNDDKTMSGEARVIDGDTIHVGENRIRLHGIDAPEKNQFCFDEKKIQYNCGEKSTIVLKKLLHQGKEQTQCNVNNQDRYGRSIATCYVTVNGEKVDIGRYMVRSGWAFAYRKYSKDYVNDENFARSKHLGLWKGDATSPWEWRKKKRNKR